MFHKDLLGIVRTRPSDPEGPAYVGGIEADGVILSGTVRSTSGETYPVRDGYLDLLGDRLGAHNIANLTNLLPGAGPGYEPLWRVRSLSLMTGQPFPNEREVSIISTLTDLDRGGLYLDLGCSAGLYSRTLSRSLGDRGDVVGVDISPSMLKEAARRARAIGARPSFVRADAERMPFADASFSGAVCGGTLNEIGDPPRVLRETRRILASGGRLAIMGILKATTVRGRRLQRFLSTGGIRFFEPAELRSILDHVGFDSDPLQIYGPVFFVGATRRG